MNNNLGVVRTLGITALLLCFIPTISYATAIGPITKIVVTANGVGPENQDCRAFILTPEQVRAFFDKAILISGRQQHDFFACGPYVARGTLNSRYDT